jgi:predicted nucleotidyltransferase
MKGKVINWDDIIDQLKKENPEKIILFGSYADGNYTLESEIDLFVIKNMPDQEKRTEKIRLKKQLRELVFQYGIAIDVHIDNPENIKQRINMGDKFYEEILQKGKILYAK